MHDELSNGSRLPPDLLVRCAQAAYALACGYRNVRCWIYRSRSVCCYIFGQIPGSFVDAEHGLVQQRKGLITVNSLPEQGWSSRKKRNVVMTGGRTNKDKGSCPLTKKKYTQWRTPVNGTQNKHAEQGCSQEAKINPFTDRFWVSCRGWATFEDLNSNEWQPRLGSRMGARNNLLRAPILDPNRGCNNLQTTNAQANLRFAIDVFSYGTRP